MIISEYWKDRVDHIIFDEFKLSGETLGIFRIFFILFSLFIIGVPDFTVLDNLPNYLYEAPTISISFLFSDFPSYFFLLSLTILIYVLHIFVLFGFKTRISSVCLTILLVIGYSFYYSLGKVNHDRMITTWIPLFLGMANWGAAYSIDSLHGNNLKKTLGWPVFLLFSLLAFGMFAAGVPKIMGGWLDPNTQAIRQYFIQHYYGVDGQALGASFLKEVNSIVLWEILDYVAIFFEIFFLLALLKKDILRYYFVIGIFFHIANLLMFNITFAGNIPIYMLLFPWSLLKNKDKFLSKIFNMNMLISFLGLLLVCKYIFGQMLTVSSILNIDEKVFDLYLMGIALGIYCLGLYKNNISYRYSIK